MLFHSIAFLVLLLPVVLAVSRWLPGSTGRGVALLLLSYLFYSGAEPLFVLVLLASTVTDYVAALAVEAAQRPALRRLWLALSVTVNLGILAFFKYSGMYAPAVAATASALGLGTVSTSWVDALVLPAGISFYTFQSMAYTVDVYRGHARAERSLLRFANFVAYLPQLIAGPIERYTDLAPQLARWAERQARPRWSAGLDRLALGIAQKLLLADPCGRVVDRLVEAATVAPGGLSTADGWAVALGFGMQIYYDFAAYTHMAIGISTMLGVDLSENFLSPYKAVSIQDFWRRWHRTLSSWFRDYLFLALAGERRGRLGTVVCLAATFLLCGLWHGAGWNFVAWGALHGAMIGAYFLSRSVLPRVALPPLLGAALTFVGVHLAWVPFRVADPQAMTRIWSAMAGLGGSAGRLVSLPDLAFLAAVTVATVVLPNAAERWPGRSGWAESILLWAVALLALLSNPDITQFIYFQF